MAMRPLFIPEGADAVRVREVQVLFKWNPGIAKSQALKNIEAMHRAGADAGWGPILEVSTRSQEPLGRSLSAFNLRVQAPGHGETSLEAAFQGSKVFEHGGPFNDIYAVKATEAKRDPRLRSSGAVTKFRLGDDTWATTTGTAFYDWLYVHAVRDAGVGFEALGSFAGFSDITYNPKRSRNCQARSCALFVALERCGALAEALFSKERFLHYLQTAYVEESSGSGSLRFPDFP